MDHHELETHANDYLSPKLYQVHVKLLRIA